MKSAIQETIDREGLRDASYLSDGVYAAHDGYQMWLLAERDGRVHAIALEHDVRQLANTYWHGIRAKYAK